MNSNDLLPLVHAQDRLVRLECLKTAGLLCGAGTAENRGDFDAVLNRILPVAAVLERLVQKPLFDKKTS